jgi:hypothetical protein
VSKVLIALCADRVGGRSRGIRQRKRFRLSPVRAAFFRVSTGGIAGGTDRVSEQGLDTSGAKARIFFGDNSGTAEAVPLPILHERRFSAEAVPFPILHERRFSAEAVPLPILHERQFSATARALTDVARATILG